MDRAPDSSESIALSDAPSHQMVVEVVARQLESMLSVGNYDGVKILLAPVQPVDVADERGVARLGRVDDLDVLLDVLVGLCPRTRAGGRAGLAERLRAI